MPGELYKAAAIVGAGRQCGSVYSVIHYDIYPFIKIGISFF